jgi:hypothetical protein
MATNYHIEGNEILSVVGPARVSVVSDVDPVTAIVEPPTISALTPDTCALGDPDFDLVVTGTNFNEVTRIVFDGHDEPTKLLSDTECSTGVKPSIFSEAKDIGVAVRTGNQVSDTLPFTFTAAGAARGSSRRKRD